MQIYAVSGVLRGVLFSRPESSGILPIFRRENGSRVSIGLRESSGSFSAALRAFVVLTEENRAGSAALKYSLIFSLVRNEKNNYGFKTEPNSKQKNTTI